MAQKQHIEKIFLNPKLLFKVIKYFDGSIVYIYNDNFFFYWHSKTNLKINLELNVIIFNMNKNVIAINNLINQIHLLGYSLNTYFLKKIKIAGKSYRIEKSGVGFNLTVGHTLNTQIYLNDVIQKQTTKHKLIFFYLNLKKNHQRFFKIIYLRLWDVYTQRGLRLGKQKLFKKQGKKSSYV